ncbi:hypothetical protein GCM10023116_12560 [Kistimonas scapharcae]|uniref:PIN domain-containing protein n=1 Tax=Kistimonas scapharcae TaxID=1036133 RepID=A0ABP8UZE7_9GAMM
MLAIAIGDVVVDLDKRQSKKLPQRLSSALVSRDLFKLIGDKPLKKLEQHERQWLSDAYQGTESFVTCSQIARAAEKLSGDSFHGNLIIAQLNGLGMEVRNASIHYPEYLYKQKGVVVPWQV